MKKLITTSVVLFIVAVCFSQKTKIGVEAGYLNVYSRLSDSNTAATLSDAGFFLGGFLEFNLSNTFTLAPHLTVGSINSSGFGFLPVLLGYTVVNKLKLEAGPQLSFILDTTPQDINALGIDFGLGASYSINNHFILTTRYNLELSNRINTMDSQNLRGQLNWLFIGLGYRF